MREGTMLLDAGTSTDVLSRASPALCASPAYTFNMSEETKPTEYITLSSPLLAIKIPLT